MLHEAVPVLAACWDAARAARGGSGGGKCLLNFLSVALAQLGRGSGERGPQREDGWGARGRVAGGGKGCLNFLSPG
jgi:hypothetical protein